jgi:hypothetical protein
MSHQMHDVIPITSCWLFSGFEMKTAASNQTASGIQQSVYKLYRKILRESIRKDCEQHVATAPDASPLKTVQLFQSQTGDTATAFARQEFRRQAASVRRSDFSRIEYMLRKGEKQWKLLKMPGVVTVGGGQSLAK